MEQLDKVINLCERLIQDEINFFPENDRLKKYVDRWWSDPCYDLCLPCKEDAIDDEADLFGAKCGEEKAEESMKKIQEYHEMISSINYAKDRVKEAEAFKAVLEFIKNNLR